MTTPVKSPGEIFEAEVTALHRQFDGCKAYPTSKAFAQLLINLTALTVKFKDIIEKPHAQSATARHALNSYKNLQDRIKEVKPKDEEIGLPDSCSEKSRLAEVAKLCGDPSGTRRKSVVAALTSPTKSS